MPQPKVTVSVEQGDDGHLLDSVAARIEALRVELAHWVSNAEGLGDRLLGNPQLGEGVGLKHDPASTALERIGDQLGVCEQLTTRLGTAIVRLGTL